jgi:DNA topoisomerase-2
MQLPDFLVEFITPIVKCIKGKEEVCFFTLPEFDNWLEENNAGKGWKVKYYKGAFYFSCLMCVS